ncbi:uncharacterized protein A4U43_C10F4060 [Asparagus officinalis]|uniref:Uncharacterized protein n=1 Tax=Asparagus officinalis TaxID=4686 RepID=A0A5P1E2A1_ASPOF|nr:UPF0481 protein At3g47200-like [Asparagus officinalis]ONK56093.1 uncharacterized protein A4U43_C10F4060 [Asparagus officinalis]
MGEQQQWIINLQSEVDEINSTPSLQRRKTPSIYRVPKILRDLHEEAYTPQIISIGPYHHGKPHLQSMEPDKRLVLAQYLQRAGMTVAQVVDAMRPMVQEIMDSYDGLEEPWTNEDRLLELMILDGCFVLDCHRQDSLQPEESHLSRGLWLDFYRLENQVPLSVLDILIRIGGNRVIYSRCTYLLHSYLVYIV